MATAMLEGFMAVCAAAVLIGAPVLMRLFTVEPELIGLGSDFLRIAAVGYLMNGFVICLQTSISGSGDTMPPMVISILTTWTILLPAAFLAPPLHRPGCLWNTLGHGAQPDLRGHGLYHLLSSRPVEE